jgi:hypothetical protein
MKSFSKLFGIAALTAVIVSGLAFTACGGGDTYTFENITPYRVQVTSSELDPGSFILDKLNNWMIDPPTRQTAVSTKYSVKITWTLPDMGGDKDIWAIMEQEGATITFKVNPEGAAANVLPPPNAELDGE